MIMADILPDEIRLRFVSARRGDGYIWQVESRTIPSFMPTDFADLCDPHWNVVIISKSYLDRADPTIGPVSRLSASAQSCRGSMHDSVDQALGTKDKSSIFARVRNIVRLRGLAVRAEWLCKIGRMRRIFSVLQTLQAFQYPSNSENSFARCVGERRVVGASFSNAT